MELYEIAFLLNGNEIGRIDFDSVKVIGCIRRNGYKGRITPAKIIEYVSQIVWNVGEQWKAEMNKEKAEFYKAAFSPDLTPEQIAIKAQQEIDKYYSTNPLDGYDDNGDPIVPTEQ